jgi:predicted nucleic acid-binding protein
MADELFVDSSGFFAMVSKDDSWHLAADRVLRNAKRGNRRLITTDYVLDETATLLKARRLGHLTGNLFDRVLNSSVCCVEWTDEGRFHSTRAFFQRHSDKQWSFTDCVSFSVMKALRISDALTSDRHFEQAGFVVLLK